jgi:hypothetical protein
MPFDDRGRWEGRFDQPPGWRIVQGTVSHHLIDLGTLICFWNRLVIDGQPSDITQYLEIAGFIGDRAYILREIQARRMDQLRTRNLEAHDNLAAAICWQRYNLFEGPSWEYRPLHSPDPNVVLREMAGMGTSFDFPIAVPPHGFRANALYRAFLPMTAFIQSGGRDSLAQCLRLLQEVRRFGIIPAYDLNWFALMPAARFLALTPFQRQRFFQACFRHGWRATPEQVEQAHAQATGA